MNKTRAKRIILGLTTVALALTVFYLEFIFTGPEIPKTTVTEYPANIFAASNEEIKSNFDQINGIDYDPEYMNCHNKSQLFGSYLKSMNATNIKTMTIARTDEEAGHEVVLWNNKVYDATSGAFNESQTEYLSFVKSKGFDGLIVVQDFQQEINNQELCQVMAGA